MCWHIFSIGRNEFRKCPRSIHLGCLGRIRTQVFLMVFHPHSMEILLNQASADWDKGGGGGSGGTCSYHPGSITSEITQQHVTTILRWAHTFHGSTSLKKTEQSLCNRPEAPSPTFLPPHLPLLQGPCLQQPSFRAFLATECTFAHQRPTGHFLCVSLRLKATFWLLLETFAERAGVPPKQSRELLLQMPKVYTKMLSGG